MGKSPWDFTKMNESNSGVYFATFIELEKLVSEGKLSSKESLKMLHKLQVELMKSQCLK